MKPYIGAAYYPELWEESEVDRDVERCKSLKINTMRIGEFAWSKMEPREGEYDFGWLERVMDKLYENGISDYIGEICGEASLTEPVLWHLETQGRDRGDKDEYKPKRRKKNTSSFDDEDLPF